MTLTLQKGFPTEMTLEDLMGFFDKHGGSEHIAMRREAPEGERKFKVICCRSEKEEIVYDVDSYFPLIQVWFKWSLQNFAYSITQG